MLRELKKLGHLTHTPVFYFLSVQGMDVLPQREMSVQHLELLVIKCLAVDCTTHQ